MGRESTDTVTVTIGLDAVESMVVRVAKAEMEVDRLRAVLSLIAVPPRPDGTWNRDRLACQRLAVQALKETEGPSHHNQEEE